MDEKEAIQTKKVLYSFLVTSIIALIAAVTPQQAQGNRAGARSMSG